MLTSKVGRMTKLLITLLLALPFRIYALELKVGDILLQPLNCWSCALIEAQERSIYSHMGIVVQTTPEVMVAEALGTVRTMSLEKFNERTEKKQKLSVRRLRNDEAVAYLESNQANFRSYFSRHFEGLQYDHDFLWNNLDENGYEKLYCSEMVTKYLRGFLGIEVPLKYMKFDVNREEWIRYFRGNPPDGKIGNSPATFENSDLFYEVGEL